MLGNQDGWGTNRLSKAESILMKWSPPLQIGVAVRHDGDPAFLSKVREKTMNKITTIGLDLLEFRVSEEKNHPEFRDQIWQCKEATR